MGNGFVRFVAHIRQAKSLPADLPVTGINHQMMFLAQPSRQVENVDSFSIFHAGERLGAESFLSKKIEAATANPVVHEGICARVTSVARLEAFRENFLQLELKRVN